MEISINMENEQLKLFCDECWKDVETHFMKGWDGWFSSWHCVECEREIAREKEGRFVIWIGGEFKERSKPQ